MHPCPGNWVTSGQVFVYLARAAHAFSAKIDVGSVCGEKNTMTLRTLTKQNKFHQLRLDEAGKYIYSKIPTFIRMIRWTKYERANI